MLKVVNYNRDEYDFPCLIVLGCFDALHKGHLELLKKAKLQANINALDLGVMIFTEGKGGRQVYTYEERLKLLEEFKTKFVLKIDFTDEFKKTTATEFLKAIDDKINVKGFMSGKDFRFGAGAEGKSSTLKSYAENQDNGVWYTSVEAVMYGDEKISTTLIKSMLESGDVKIANELLGRKFSVSGTVVGGAERGHRILGFPTINIEYPQNKIEVKHGVYAVICHVGSNCYKGVANYGARPTFDEEKPILEVHLDAFDGNIYGNEVTVEFCEYLRDIQKFASAEALKAQLEQDILKLATL